MATSDLFQAKIAAFARQLAEEFGEIDEENLDEHALSWLDAIETRAVAIGDAVTTELLRQKSSDRPTEDESACPQCGKLGRYRGQRERELIGRRGPVTISEPEYFCPCCRKSSPFSKTWPEDQGDRR
jgi:hypothetical protein